MYPTPTIYCIRDGLTFVFVACYNHERYPEMDIRANIRRILKRSKSDKQQPISNSGTRTEDPQAKVEEAATVSAVSVDRQTILLGSPSAPPSVYKDSVQRQSGDDHLDTHSTFSVTPEPSSVESKSDQTTISVETLADTDHRYPDLPSPERSRSQNVQDVDNQPLLVLQQATPNSEDDEAHQHLGPIIQDSVARYDRIFLFQLHNRPQRQIPGCTRSVAITGQPTKMRQTSFSLQSIVLTVFMIVRTFPLTPTLLRTPDHSTGSLRPSLLHQSLPQLSHHPPDLSTTLFVNNHSSLVRTRRSSRNWYTTTSAQSLLLEYLTILKSPPAESLNHSKLPRCHKERYGSSDLALRRPWCLCATTIWWTMFGTRFS